MKRLSKVLIAMALTLVMLTSGRMSVFASNSVNIGVGSNDASVPIELDIGPSYIVSLPATITLEKLALPQTLTYSNGKYDIIPVADYPDLVSEHDLGVTSSELISKYCLGSNFDGYVDMFDITVAANLLDGETLYLALDACELQTMYSDGSSDADNEYNFYIRTMLTGSSSLTSDFELSTGRFMTSSKTDGGVGENSNYMMYEFGKGDVATCKITDGLPAVGNSTTCLHVALGINTADIKRYESFTTDLIVKFGLNEMPDLMH